MKNRRVVPILATLGMLFAVLFVVVVRPKRVAGSPSAAPPAARSENTIAAVGLVEPESENIALSCPVSGMVTALYVHSGDMVHKGQPLFAVDDRDVRADLHVKEASLVAAKANLLKLSNEPRPEELPPAEARVDAARAAVEDTAVQVRLIESVTDRRAVREEDVERRRAALAGNQAKLAEAQKSLALLKAGAWQPDLLIAEAAVAQAAAAVQQARVNLTRLTTSAPLDGKVLQSHVRLGQYAQCGGSGTDPLIVFGGGGGLHVRADVDETDAWRVRPGTPAYASVRGNSDLRYPVEFVRMEPYVVPKKSLTGDSTERVDTRVLQVIFRFADGHVPVYDGQQMDLYIEAAAQPQQASLGSRGQR